MPISRKVKEHIGKASWIRRMFEEGRALKARIGAENVFAKPLDPADLIARVEEILEAR